MTKKNCTIVDFFMLSTSSEYITVISQIMFQPERQKEAEEKKEKKLAQLR